MNRRRVKIFVLALGIVVVFILFTITGDDSVFCYDTNIAHPNIADLAAKVYKESTGQELSNRQIDCLRTGAEDEDMPIRWMNHFYDPVYNVGFKSVYLTSKDWSRASELQRDYAFGDQTWQRAIMEYRDGNKEEAFCILGHILHLIADMSVPAHTRDDAHPEGDSYEQFVKYNWDLLYTGLENIDMDLIYYSKLDNYFDNLSKYSNNNFYSDHTLEINKYNIVEVVNSFSKNEIKLEYNLAELHGIQYYLFLSDNAWSWQDGKNGMKTLNDQFILTDYTKHLLPQAVGYSAGVIKLFFEEVEKDQDFDLNDNKISFIGKMGNMLGWGVNKLADFKQYVGGDKDVVMADENTVLSIMGIDYTDLDNDSTEVIENTDYAEDEEYMEVIESVQEPKVEKVVPVQVNIPVPPGFINNDTNYTEKEDYTDTSKTESSSTEVNDDDVVTQVYSGGGGSSSGNSAPVDDVNTATSTPETTDDGDDTTNTATSTPSGDEDDVIGDTNTATSTPADDDSDADSDNQNQDDEVSATTTLPIITITSHEAVSYIDVATTSVAGTRDEDVVNIFINNVSSTVEFSSSSVWEVEVDLLEGENIFEMYGENGDGLKSNTSTIIIILDTSPPEITNLTVLQTNSATPTLQIDWQAIDSGVGVEYYDLDYKVNDGDWKTVVTSTASSTWQIESELLNSYIFRVRAYDSFGHISEWLESDGFTSDWPKTVVINEVAWMGTNAGNTSDEWLELYNNSDEDVDLTGWKILVSDKMMNWDNIGHIIPAGGYYLLERTDNGSVLEITADGIFTVSGGLGNSGESLILMDNASSTIDAVDSSNGWFAGITDVFYRTMERLDPMSPGSLVANWQTSESVAPKGSAQGGGVIFGSPGYQNSNYWLLFGDLSLYYADLIVDNKLILNKTNSPYIISLETVIPSGLTVEIEPGVVLMGLDKASYINVKGDLIINGTAEEPVVFTSALDKNYVEMNLTRLSGDIPEPGDWSRIEIEEGGNVQASYTKFLYGGQTFVKGNNWVYGWKWISQVLRNTGGTMTLDSVEVAYNFVDDDEDNLSCNSAIWTESVIGYDANTIINNSILDSGYTAVNFHGSNNGQTTGGSLINSTLKNFTDNEAVIKIKQAQTEIDNIIFENNLSNFIDMDYFKLSNDYTLKQDSKYSFTGIEIPSGITLTIESGVDVKLSSAVLVDGSLHANGTIGQPINFIPKDNYWNIMLFQNSNSNLSNVNIVKGNSGNNSLRDVKKRGMVTIENSTVNFDNVNFMDAMRPYQMIYTENSDVSIKDSIISWTDEDTSGKNIDGIKQKGGSLNLDNVTFNRMDRGIEILSSGSIGMENMTLGHFQNISDLNWWPANAFSF